MNASSKSDSRTLILLNQISEMLASQTQPSEVFRAIANAVQELTQARYGLVLHFPPAQPVEFYGSEEALLFGPSLLHALKENTSLGTHSVMTLTTHASDTASNSMSALTTTIFQGQTLRGVLSALYEQPPEDTPSDILTLLSNQARIAMKNWRLEKSVQETYPAVLEALASLIESRDPFARRHLRAVTDYAVALAQALSLNEDQINTIRYGAILHDIGKIGIREDILSKQGPLLPNERAHIETHPEVGEQILLKIPYWEEVAKLIRHHHEHYDGGGYPDGLRGDEIPLGAQIIAVADVFDAVTTGDRSYHIGRNIIEACTILREESGKWLNPELVEIFIQMINGPLETFDD